MTYRTLPDKKIMIIYLFLNFSHEKPKRVFYFSGVQVATLELEQRLNVLEENVNSSVVELEGRVETLELTDLNHESRLSSAETLLEGNISAYN